MGGFGSGGARKNAGRKPIDGRTRTKLSVSLPTWQLEQVKSEATRLRLPLSNLISELITKGLK